MARDIDGAIAERAPKSLGLFTTTQLNALGVTRQRRRTLMAKGVLVPLGGGVLRHAAHPPSWRQQVLAAVLAAGDGAVASHMSAAALWRFDGIARSTIEVTVPRHRQPRTVPGTVHRSLDLTAADVDERSRIPQATAAQASHLSAVSHNVIPRTTAARTLLDIADRLTPAELEAVLDGAERDGKIWRPHLRWRIEALRRRGRGGVSVVAALLDRTEGRALGDSWLERRTIQLIDRAGLPVPRTQVEFHAGGRLIARVDMLWDDARLVVEVDGHGTHATRRERQADAERSARLGLEGWHVVRFTYEDVVERAGHVIATIRAYLERFSGVPTR